MCPGTGSEANSRPSPRSSSLPLGGIALIAYNELKRPGDVSNPDVAFKEPAKKPKTVPKDKTVNWTTFRYNRSAPVTCR